MSRENNPVPISTKIKNNLNAILNLVGLEISTTRLRVAREKFLRELEIRDHWDTLKYTAGYLFEDDKYLTFVDQLASKYSHEYNQFYQESSDKLLPSDYFLRNGYFEAVDAHIAYAMVRDYQPNCVIEVGSGHSTKVLKLAIKTNNKPCRLLSIDPQPRTSIVEVVDENVPSEVELLDPNYITSRLGSRDILFIDSSHSVTMAGDVVFLFLQVLPHLKSGTLIHIHDIFLPYEYPKRFIPYMWNEQYLVHAFLYSNTDFEILWPSYYMWKTHESRLTKLFAHAETSQPPSSLWLRKL
ncbi:MAG: class I SAM-dependent methyltransferase [Aggregatilineales bacterium]